MVSLFEQFRLLHAGWRDVLQIAIVSFVIYRVLLLVHRTRALQVLVGLLLLAVSYGVAYVLQLGVIVYLLTLVSNLRREYDEQRDHAVARDESQQIDDHAELQHVGDAVADREQQ